MPDDKKVPLAPPDPDPNAALAKLTGVRKATSIGPPKVGTRYVPMPHEYGERLMNLIWGHQRPPSVIAQDPYGIEAYLKGAGDRPGLMMPGIIEGPMPQVRPATAGRDILSHFRSGQAEAAGIAGKRLAQTIEQNSPRPLTDEMAATIAGEKAFDPANPFGRVTSRYQDLAPIPQQNFRDRGASYIPDAPMSRAPGIQEAYTQHLENQSRLQQAYKQNPAQRGVVQDMTNRGVSQRQYLKGSGKRITPDMVAEIRELATTTLKDMSVRDAAQWLADNKNYGIKPGHIQEIIWNESFPTADLSKVRFRDSEPANVRTPRPYKPRGPKPAQGITGEDYRNMRERLGQRFGKEYLDESREGFRDKYVGQKKDGNPKE